jgi:putative tricarboxylic transport membrane protein
MPPELVDGFVTMFSNPMVLVWCLIGITVGTLVGALPGVGPVTGMAVLLPLTFSLDQLSALVLLMSVYNGAMYGGRITSILVNVPGDAGAVVTCFDGYPLARQGRAGYALTLSAVASFIGGMVGFVGLVFLTTYLAKLAIIFGPTEYFALMLFALLATCGLTQKRPFKSIVATFFGVLISTIGLDSVSGAQRLTFNMVHLWDGVDLAVLAIGIFGLSETLLRLEEGKAIKSSEETKFTYGSLFPKVSEVLSNGWAMVRGSLIGFFVGVLPGAGSVLATFLAYSAEKKLSKHPEKFGTGVPQGLSSPEAANNSSVGGALIPTFALGIPGSGSTAILLGGLMMVGLQPGPLLFQNSGDVVWAAFAGFFVANVLLLFMNTAFVPGFTYLIQKADPYMVPLIASLCFVGVYMVNFNLFDVGVMIIFGLIGYFLRKAQFPLAPLFLGFILGPMIEKSMRQALSISIGDFSIFFVKPISLFFLILTVLVFLAPHIGGLMKKKQKDISA